MQQVQRKDLFRRREKKRGSMGLESQRERNPKVWNQWEDRQGKGKNKENQEIVGILRIFPQKPFKNQEKEIFF